MNRKIERISLVEQVYKSIIDNIQNGTIAQGERLNIEELANAFGVSRTPVREAISKLTQEGFVEEVYNAGPRAAKYNSKQILDIVRCNATLFSGVIDSYKSLSGEVYSEFTRRLKGITNAQRNAFVADAFDLFYENSIQFHIAMIMACPNESIKKFALQTQYQINMCALYYQKEAPNRERSLREHEQILQRLEEKGFAAASLLMENHNRFAEETLQKSQED